jgi:hypothetical protein
MPILIEKANLRFSNLSLILWGIISPNNIYQKGVDVQISERRCTVVSYKGEVERSHPLFSARKQ